MLYFIKQDKCLKAINIKDICLIESQGDYVKINMVTGNYVIHSTMKDILDKLPPKDFYRIHNSYIVRCDKITSIEGNCVTVNKRVIPVSQNNIADFKNTLTIL